MINNKKGIALFSTLLIMVLVIILMTISLRNTSNIKQSILSDRYLIQENLTITDIIKYLEDKLFVKIKDIKDIGAKEEILKLLFSSPLSIENEYDNSKVIINLKANDGLMNINHINATHYESYIKDIFKQIGITDPTLLAEIIMANYEKTDKYREDYRLNKTNPDFKYGNILSLEVFQKIIDIYISNSDDETSAKNIEYQKYFKFLDIKKTDQNHLNFNNMDIKLIDAIVTLNSEVRKQIIEKTIPFTKYDELNLRKDDEVNEEALLTEQNIKFETKNILIQINIESINYSVECMFNYDYIGKTITNLEMDRWKN